MIGKGGAYADMLLIDGNPLQNLDLVVDLQTNFKLCEGRQDIEEHLVTNLDGMNF
jgi:hypothetical protein